VIEPADGLVLASATAWCRGIEINVPDNNDLRAVEVFHARLPGTPVGAELARPGYFQLQECLVCLAAQGATPLMVFQGQAPLGQCDMRSLGKRLGGGGTFLRAC